MAIRFLGSGRRSSITWSCSQLRSTAPNVEFTIPRPTTGMFSSTLLLSRRSGLRPGLSRQLRWLGVVLQRRLGRRYRRCSRGCRIIMGSTIPMPRAVLINCRLKGIPAAGWGPLDDDTTHMHLWEFNSADLDGKPIDTSQRHPVSRQLKNTGFWITQDDCRLQQSCVCVGGLDSGFE